MRELTNHKGDALNDMLDIAAVTATNYEVYSTDGELVPIEINFQAGALADGINGLTDQVLVTILVDYLEQRQLTQPSRYNETALHYLQAAQVAMQNRDRA